MYNPITFEIRSAEDMMINFDFFIGSLQELSISSVKHLLGFLS